MPGDPYVANQFTAPNGGPRYGRASQAPTPSAGILATAPPGLGGGLATLSADTPCPEGTGTTIFNPTGFNATDDGVWFNDSLAVILFTFGVAAPTVLSVTFNGRTFSLPATLLVNSATFAFPFQATRSLGFLRRGGGGGAANLIITPTTNACTVLAGTSSLSRFIRDAA